jgi:hypothetical protein
MIVHLDKPCTPSEIKAALEGSDEQQKVAMLKKAIAMSLTGEQIPGLFICVIRDVLLSKDKTIQRLLLYYLVSVSPSSLQHRNVETRLILFPPCRKRLRKPMQKESCSQRWFVSDFILFACP